MTPNKMVNVHASEASGTSEWGPHLPEASTFLLPNASLIPEDPREQRGHFLCLSPDFPSLCIGHGEDILDELRSMGKSDEPFL